VDRVIAHLDDQLKGYFGLPLPGNKTKQISHLFLQIQEQQIKNSQPQSK
jgi:hypothetical protein